MSITRLSALPYSNKLVVPDNAEKLNANQIIAHMNLAHIPFSGHVIMGPILARIEERLIAYAGSLAQDHGFLRLNLPTFTPKNILEKSGRLQEFGSQIYGLADPHQSYVVTPSTEESVIDYIAPGLQSYRQLPMRFWHDHSVFRHHQRAEGIYKTRDIRCVVMTTIDKDHNAFLETASLFKLYCHDFFKAIGANAFCVEEQESGAVEFLACSELGDRTISQSVVRRFGNNSGTGVDVSENAKYTSMAMGYPYRPAERMGIAYEGKNGLALPVVGTFGIGVNRAIGNMIERSKNGDTDAFPKAMRPFDIALLKAGGKDDRADQPVADLACAFSKAGYHVAIDDRNLNLNTKIRLADFFNVPVHITMGPKEAQNGLYKVKGFPELVPLENIVKISERIPGL
jgi:prolyl-tRNA synthetase